MFAVRAPITSRDDRLVDTERFHQGDDIDRDRRLLAVPRRVAREEARGAIAAQIRHNHAVAFGGEDGRHIDEAVDIVGPAVEQDDGGPVGGAGFGIADIEETGIDLLQRCERGVRSRFHVVQTGRF